MTDIARLSFDIDSSKAKSASGDLDNMSQASLRAQQSAALLQRGLDQGRMSFEQYAQSMLLVGNSATNATRSLDEIVDRVSALSKAMSSIGGDSGRPLREAIAQMEGMGRQFGTGAAGLENFTRASRDVGLSAQETVGSLQRIQLAIEGVTEQGRQARQVLEAMGVSMRNVGPQGADGVLRQFRDRIGNYTDDMNMTRNINTVLGPVGSETMMALTWPEYRTEDQRRREIESSTESRRQALLRDNVMGAQRNVDSRTSRRNDLENTYGSWFDPQSYNPFEDPNDQMDRLNAVRRSGERPWNWNSVSRGLSGSYLGQWAQRQSNGAVQSDQAALETLQDLDREDGVGNFITRPLSRMGQQLMARVSRSSVLDLNQRDRLDAWANPYREQSPDSREGQMADASEAARMLNEEERRGLRGGLNQIDGSRAAMLESSRQAAERMYPNASDADSRAGYMALQRGAFERQVGLMGDRWDNQMRGQISVMGAGADYRASGDYINSVQAQAQAQAAASGLANPNRLLEFMATQGVYQSSIGSGRAQTQAGIGADMALAATSGVGSADLSASFQRSGILSQFAEPIAAAQALGRSDLADKIREFAEATVQASTRLKESSAQMQLALTGRGVAAGINTFRADSVLSGRDRFLERSADQESLRINGATISSDLDPRERLAEARRLRLANPEMNGIIMGGINLQQQIQADDNEQRTQAQVNLALAGTSGRPGPDRAARLAAQIAAIRLGENTGLNEQQVRVVQAQDQGQRLSRYNSFGNSLSDERVYATLRSNRVSGLVEQGTLPSSRRAVYGGGLEDLDIAADRAVRSDSTADPAMVRFMKATTDAANAIERLGLASAQSTIKMDEIRRLGAANAFSPYEGGLERSRQQGVRERDQAYGQADVLRREADRQTDPTRAAELRRNADDLQQRGERRVTDAVGEYRTEREGAFEGDYSRLLRGRGELELQLNNPLASDRRMGRDLAVFRAGQQLDQQYAGREDQLDPTKRRNYLNEVGQQYDQQQMIVRNREIRDTFVGIAEAGGNALEQIIVRGRNAKQVMAELAASAAMALAKLALKPVTDGIGNWLGSAFSLASGGGPTGYTYGAGGYTGMGPFTPSAMGNVFDAGFIRPMAQGEVMEGPTMRPMANGRTALMGEAGPEAAVPLVRMPSGNLGIRADGGGGGTYAPNITINMTGGGGGGGGGPEQAKLIAEQVRLALKQSQEEHLRDSMRLGGVLNPIFKK